MWRKFWVLGWVLLGTLGLAQAHEPGEIYVYNVWTAPTIEGEPNFVYLTLHNTGEHAIALRHVETPVSAAVELQSAGAVAETLPIEAEAEVTFSAETYRIVLNEVKQPLVAGQAFALLLHFDMLNEDGTSADEPLYAVTAALVTEEAPAGSIQFINAWARPTVPPMPNGFGMGMMGGMNMGEATAEPPMGGGMNMGEATAEPPMGGGGMNMGGGGMMNVSAIYMKIINTGDSAARLVAASVEVAGLAQIHESKMVDNVMKMEELPNGLELLPDELVSLQQGGLHIMLMELNAPLEQGNALVVTLTFEDGSTQLLAVPIFDQTMLMMGH